MKTLELNKKALDVMQRNNVDEAFATKDGNIFLAKNKSAADFHARNTNQKVYHLKKSELLKEEETSVKTDLNENITQNTDSSTPVEEITEETKTKRSKKTE